MEVENSVTIAAPVEHVASTAAQVERWPAMLPHYRSVEVRGDRDGGRLLAMRAWRGRIPVRWEAIVWWEPDIPRIRFRHTAGFTKGMLVEWRFERQPAPTHSVRVVIAHHMADRNPRFLWRSLNRVIAEHFVDYIARRTLTRMKELLEAELVTCAAE